MLRSRFDKRLAKDIADFRQRVLTDPTGVLDPEDIHHEFVRGDHGRKLDFDKILTYSDFYIEWVSIYARVIRALYKQGMPDALVGIANGANRLSKSVSTLLGEDVLGLTTVKMNDKTVKLDETALESIKNAKIHFVLVIEDVGTTGSTMATAVEDLRRLGVKHIEAITAWQRKRSLSYLDELHVPYSTVILDPLPSFSPEDCANRPEGYCARNVHLVEYKK